MICGELALLGRSGVRSNLSVIRDEGYRGADLTSDGSRMTK